MTTPPVRARDLGFLLHDWLDLKGLLAYPHFQDHSVETVDAMLDIAGRVAADTFLTHYKAADSQEPHLVEGQVRILPAIHQALAAFAEVGMFAAPFDAEVGGLQLPQLAYSAAMAHFMAANVATSAYPMLTTGNAKLLVRYANEALVKACALPEIEGRYFGTMCLSEPQAGSSLADIATRAVPDGDDGLGARYRLFGNKMWISGGDQDASENIIHLVLAKVPGPDGKLIPGTQGISLFVVPKVLVSGSDYAGQRNDVVVAGLNHKMGYRGTANCLLNFGEGAHHRPGGIAGAVGYRVGGVGQGLPIMFQMMNSARISVGLGAAMLGYRGYRLAVDYARDRRQGRPIGGRGGAPIAIIDHPDVRRLLLAQKAYAEGALALVLYCARLVDEELHGPAEGRDEAAGLLSLLTPIAKTWPSEWGLAANDLAIQVHGGYGYTRDFDVEQLYRDNRLNPIHEGTTGVQGLDLMGRKTLKDDGASLATLRHRVTATVERARHLPALADFAHVLDVTWARIGALVGHLKAAGDDVASLAQATSFLSAFGHAVVAWQWLDQAVVAGSLAATDDPDETAFRAGKLAACRFFFETEVPRVDVWLGIVGRRSDLTQTFDPAGF
ncbi:acyl-CoA dehydrogenase [Nitrospirillum amazonense]|uniref:Alkylation response protein AidB-like acyl-CoA dehydrogenase n=1 Tax=Nitrospirillum amazonense TaxID=28077 RepID=A0A560K2U0_9PROT|nr:acyl-CoA dehydrogenase [Nitrospirillum amazonense]MDG3444103.1 acyl-CoA dehydrogenase [Nitrospirillum amazonense]TWB77658.1 alkylation response protein AidB-like acyl-CoA dehydrogenase [Nitrospirillum amazonense]